MFRMLALILGLFLLVAQASAERIALVIGNSHYETSTDLPQTSADAIAIASKLESLGFGLVGNRAHIDLDRSQMIVQIRAFGRAVEAGDEAVFYFSGHGIGGAQTNYLLPSDDGQIETREDVADFAVDVSSILQRLPETGGGVNIMILDACRDNPLPSAAKSAFAEKGLTRISQNLASSVFLYAAEPGKQAYVGPNGKSYFTEALLNALDTPGQDLTALARRLRHEVSVATATRPTPQRPWLEGVSENPFYFLPGDETQEPAVTTPATSSNLIEPVGSTALPAAKAIGAAPIPDDLNLADPQAKQAITTCRAGDLRSCEELGQALYFGRGAPKMPEAGTALFKHACDAGSLAGCSFLGAAHRSGLGARLDYAEAKRLFTRSCSGGFPSACSGLGEIYQRGLGVPPDSDKAFSNFNQACRGGDNIGCYGVGSSYLNGIGVPIDRSQAISYFEDVCRGGLPQACNDLGFMHQKGIGMDTDYTRAQMFYEQACDSFWAISCLNIAIMYADGLIAPPNDEIVTALLGKACAIGGTDLCATWGYNLYHGQGVTADTVNGFAMLSIACEDGSAAACNFLEALP